MQQIAYLNNLFDGCERILVGQKLLIPWADAPDAPPPVATTASPLLPGDIYVSPVDGMTMAYVPAGVFLRGSSSADSQAGDDERPQQVVYLEAFWIDRTEVTNAMYAQCVQAEACRQPGQRGSSTRISYYNDPSYANYPVLYVAWQDAQDYCRWAGRRLPGEAEWEKAARGVDGRIYPWGNAAPDSSLANYDNQVGDTVAVGSYAAGASPYGVLDMAGNVAEWVADWYIEDYYVTAPVIAPFGPQKGEYRGLRGGSWFSAAYRMRAAFRFWYTPDLGFDASGFRCAQ
jgi:formylglycine-generating enzyme required for sulfatase activity